MKILLNENEFYNLEIPSEINIEQFKNLLERLKVIERLIGKNKEKTKVKIIHHDGDWHERKKAYDRAYY